MNNIFSLAAIQGGNALFPIIAFPFILKIIGKYEFSLFVTGEAWSILVLAICMFGFDVSGVRKVQIAEKNNVNEIVSLIFFSRLLIFGFIFLLSIFLSVFPWYKYFLIFLLVAVGNILQSQYYFQSVGLNKIPAKIVIFFRVIALFLIFLGMHFHLDGFVFALIIGASYFLSGLFCFLEVEKRNPLNFKFFKVDIIFNFMKEDFYIFLSNSSVIFYRGLNVVIYSYLSSNVNLVGIYALAEKYIKIIQSAVLPISNHYMPMVMRKLNEKNTKENYYEIIIRYTKKQIYLVSILVIIIDIIFIFAWKLNLQIINSDFLIMFLIMSPTPVVGVASFMFGYVGLNALRMESCFAKVVISVGLLAVGGLVCASYFSNIIFLCMIYFLSELLISIICIFLVKNKC